MSRVRWPLRNARPCVQVVLTLVPTGKPLIRTLLADSGAGSLTSRFHLILEEDDCLYCGGIFVHMVSLRGAYQGGFPLYSLPVAIPALAFQKDLCAVGVPTVPTGFEGIACFAFLNSFTYGNFADPGKFGLEG